MNFLGCRDTHPISSGIPHPAQPSRRAFTPSIFWALVFVMTMPANTMVLKSLCSFKNNLLLKVNSWIALSELIDFFKSV
jgi:hypothetical protein